MGSHGGSRAGGSGGDAASIASKLTTPLKMKDRGGLPEPYNDEEVTP